MKVLEMTYKNFHKEKELQIARTFPFQFGLTTKLDLRQKIELVLQT